MSRRVPAGLPTLTFVAAFLAVLGVGVLVTKEDRPVIAMPPAITTAIVSGCDTSTGISVGWSINDDNPPVVTGVTLGDVPQECAALPITVSILDATGGVLASVTVPPQTVSGNTSVAFDLTQHLDGVARPGVAIPPIEGLTAEIPDPFDPGSGTPLVVTAPPGNDVTLMASDSSSGAAIALQVPGFSNGVTATFTGSTEPAPSGGFSAGGILFDLSLSGVTVSPENPVTLCLFLAPGTLTAEPPALVHFVDGTWETVASTWDASKGQLCGTVTHFSPFAVGTIPTATTVQPSPTTADPGDPVTGTATVTGGAPDGNGGSLDPEGSITFGYCRADQSADTTACPDWTTFSGPDGLTGAGGGTGTSTATSGTPLTPMLPGWYRLRAEFSADTTTVAYLDSSSDTSATAPATQLVFVRYDSSTATALSAATVPLSGSVTDTVTVTGAAPVQGGSGTLDPTGNVTFTYCYDAATAPASCTLAETDGTIGTVALGAGTTADDGSATATSPSFTPTQLGFYRVLAVYAGDATYRPSDDPAGANESLEVNAAGTTTTTAVSTAEIAFGDSVTDTVTVTTTVPASTVDPTGNVTFTYCYDAASAPTSCTLSDTDGTIGTKSLASDDTADGSASATTDPWTPSTAGWYRILATYAGDAGYGGSDDTTGANEVVHVLAAATTTTTQISASSGEVGTLVTDTATVSSASSTDPTGSVRFFYCFDAASAPATCTTSDTDGTIGTATLAGGSNAADGTATATSPSFRADQVGWYRVLAIYGGDANFSGSEDTAGSNELFQATAAASTTATQVSAASIAYGKTITDLATVAGFAARTGGGYVDPTGWISFEYCFTATNAAATTATASGSTQKTPGGPGAPSSCADGAGTWIANVTLSGGTNVADGRATATMPAWTPPAPGYYLLHAVYHPDATASYTGSSDPGTNERTFVFVPTTTSLQAAPGSSAYGAPVTLTAYVTGAGWSPNGGVVQFIDTPNTGSGRTLGTCTVTGGTDLTSGSCSLVVSTLSAQNHKLVAWYLGVDAGVIQGSSSSVVPYNVALSPVTPSLLANTTTPPANSPVTFTFTATPPYSGSDATLAWIAAPSGKVTFKDGTATVGSCTLGSAQTGATSCFLTLTFATTGGHVITASYAGDTSYLPASATTTVNVLFGSITTVTATPTSLTYGANVTLAAKVVGSGSTAIPGGTITFTYVASGGGTAIALTTCKLGTAGTCSVTWTKPSAGSWVVRASYGGSAVYTPSSGVTGTITVAKAATTTKLATSATTIKRPKTVTLTATVASTAGTPTGSVTLTFTKTGSPTVTVTVALSNGKATYSGWPTASTAAGTWTIAAAYSGDANFSASSGSVTVTVQ